MTDECIKALCCTKKSMCLIHALRGQAISESAVLFGPVPLQTLQPHAEPEYLGSEALPSWWPQPAALGAHTDGCSCTGGSGQTHHHAGPPCTVCPPVSDPPWSPTYFERWTSLEAGHPEDCPQIPLWPSGGRQSRVDSVLTRREFAVHLCHCWTQRSGASYHPE